MEAEKEGGGGVTGRDAINYILANNYDDKPLVVYIEGKEIPVYDICYEFGRKQLVILPDYRAEDE